MSAPLQVTPISYYQPTKPTEAVVDDENLDRHRQLESIFRSVVINAISALNFPPPSVEKNTSQEVLEDVPKTIGEPNEHDSTVVIPCPVVDINVSKSTNVAATQDPGKARLKRSIMIAKENLIFEVPTPSLVDQIDMDKLPSVDEENNLIVAPMRRFSYRERLTGWTVELRQREKNDKREKVKIISFEDKKLNKRR
ncbi:hypothetical protein Lalb_Chr22g0355631 [Lupinus albus]|uniref:Uncharacterized protein n=1 Tax=Lupinus albus TaxID=3870 RepID=A0A6A4NPC5_LUPAL|nr:hypothetical protein Lalb_Chr22g0355631 [Lupinus albus]